MQFVTGGAFNGKSSWVRAYNQINGGSKLDFCLSPSSFTIEFRSFGRECVVIEGIEQWIKELLTEFDAEAVRENGKHFWKNGRFGKAADQGRMVILIGSDITKGIVPIEAENRVWRDVTGRVFQDTVSICNRVDLIWYGINKRLK